MAERTFIDTNVLVYAVDRGEPRKRDRGHVHPRAPAAATEYQVPNWLGGAPMSICSMQPSCSRASSNSRVCHSPR